MADENAPVVENPGPAPSQVAQVEAPAAPQPVAGASASPEPSPAPTPAPDAPKHPSETPTLLETMKAPAEPGPAKEEAKAPEPEKPADPANVPEKVEAKPEDKKPEEPKAPEVETPVEYKFEWSEHVKPEAEKVEAFTALAREAKMTPEQAQKAVGMFNDAASAYKAEQSRNQIETWNNTRADWRKQALADPMIGGSGHMHAMGVIARTRDMIVSDAQPGTPQYESDAKAVDEFLRVTGAGDHPVFLKMLYRAGGRLDEPRMITAVPQPTKTNGQKPNSSLYAPKADAAMKVGG